MTPYYQDDFATIYHGDYREIQDAVFAEDMVIVTDPPYGIGFDYGSRDFRDTEAGFRDLIRPLRDYPLALLQYPELMMRLVAPELGPPTEVLTWVYNSNLPRQSRMWGIWNTEIDFGRVKQPAKNPECKKVRSALVASYDWLQFSQVKGNGSQKLKHPCQLPIQVVDWVIRLCSPFMVVDPMMGTGTALRAAKNLRIPSIGVDREERYCEIAAKRLAQEVLAL